MAIPEGPANGLLEQLFFWIFTRKFDHPNIPTNFSNK